MTLITLVRSREENKLVRPNITEIVGNKINLIVRNRPSVSLGSRDSPDVSPV